MSTRSPSVEVLSAAGSFLESMPALIEDAAKRCPQPVSALQVAALLESSGITDAAARQKYGYDDVFELAEAVTQGILESTHLRAQPLASSLGANGSSHTRRQPQGTLGPDSLMDYARGPLSLLPMILVSLIIAAYQEMGQWEAYQVVTLGASMLGSLLVTSGFIQAASRKGAGYLSQGYVRAATAVVVRIVAAGALVVLVTAAAAGALVHVALGWLPGDVALMVVAYVALSILWLTAAVLFLVEASHWFGGSLAVGVGLSWATLQVSAMYRLPRDWALLSATIVGMCGTAGIAWWVIRRELARRMATAADSARKVVLPPRPHLLISVLPYFAYGVCYVALILAGHIAGWMGLFTSRGDPMQVIAAVEIGLTIALGGHILAGGVAENTVRRFWARVRADQEQTPLYRPVHFNQTLERFYVRERNRFLVAVLLCSVLILAVVVLALRVGERMAVTGLPWSEATTLLFLGGLIGYGLLAWGSFNCTFMISLSRPGDAIQSLVVGMLLTLLQGIGLSLVVSFQYSAIGIVVGSLGFAIVASSKLQDLLSRADYYYYASF